MSGMFNFVVVNEHNVGINKVSDADPCNALMSYFDYEQEHVACQSYSYQNQQTKRRALMNEFDNDDHHVVLSFNFSLMFKNETAYRECIEHIESVEFGQLFEARLRQQMDENVVNVSIV